MKVISRADAKKQGLKRYFTGKKCPSGHLAERQVSNHTCCICIRIKQLKWQKDKKKQHNKQNRKYRQNLSDKRKEEVRQTSEDWRRRNRNKVCGYAKIYRCRHLTKVKERIKQWRNKNPLRVREHQANRRCSKLKATLKWVNRKEIQMMYLNCPKGYEVDHIVPLQGKMVCGLHVPWNLQYLTREENSRKHNTWDPEIEG